MTGQLKRLTSAGLLAVFSLGMAVPLVYADEVRPIASFTFSPAAPVAGEQVTFTSTSTDAEGSIRSQAWDLDDDGRFDDGTGVTATRTFIAVGSYTVRLEVVDDEGDSRRTSRTVTVAANGAPTAAFSASPPEVDTGQTVTFTSSSTDPEGRPLAHAWDLDDDGAYDDGTGTSASTSFATDGTRRVGLRVTDSGGKQDTASVDVVVRNRPPTGSFTVSATVADTGEQIDFRSTASDPDGTVVARRWDFDGDGTTDATGTNVSHAFADDGTPAVTLTVVDDDGATHTSTRQLTINNRPPAAAFDVSATEADTGDAIQFSSTSTDPDGSIASHEWDFDGDGTADATGADVSHAFADDGAPTVDLTVTDDDGAKHTATRTLTIRNRAPSAGFGFEPSSPVAGDVVTLTSTAADPDGLVAIRSWDLDGDGRYDDAGGATASRSFDAPGSYVVGHRAVDDDGAAAASFQTIEVAPRPPGPPAGGGDAEVAAQPTLAPALVALPRMLAPFPLVRIKGVTTRRGVRVDMLSVRTPGDTRILALCKGRGCPYTRRVVRARHAASRLGVVKLPGFTRRYIRAGAVLQVYVTRPNAYGKYTRFVFRGSLKPPKRVDRCTEAGRATVRRCAP